jgi:hypothetical protein
MNLAPLDLSAAVGTVRYALLFGAIGFGFGFILEMAGFGDTRKLAAQFYLKDMTVLKVMFTGIVVAALLVALASSFGLLDLHRVWVNPTFLWSELAGGLIMGVGFVLGGFCPGTSLVAAATLKIDGMLFLVGALIGVWAFGETVGTFEPFWLSSDFGRFTLPDWLGLPMGVVVALIVVVAIAAFRGAEMVEARFGGVSPTAGGRARRPAAFALLAAASILVVHGQPTPEQQWARVAPATRQRVESRAIFASPAEVVSLRKDTSLEVSLLDLRDEHDFNLFHVGGARRLDDADTRTPALVAQLLGKPAWAVTFLVSNGEAEALRAWESLTAQGVPNLYIVEGGINRWLELYAAPTCVAAPMAQGDADALAYRFQFATGQSLPAASPELPTSRGFRLPCGSENEDETLRVSGEHHGNVWPEHPFVKRVQLQTKSVVKGGCG